MSAVLEQQGMSLQTWESFRALFKSDPWDFALDICGFDKLVERFHKPVLYLLTHQTALLIEVLKGPLRSAVITKIKRALHKRKYDFDKPEHFARIEVFIRTLNIRIARKLGKTSCGEAAILWDITLSPDHQWAIVSRDDPSAQAMCAMIVKIIQSDAYRFFFPDRIPENEHINLTRSAILLAGRTKIFPQPCVTAGGVDSGWVSMHFDRVYGDDLVGRENKSPAKLATVHEFQANRNGLRIPEWDAPHYDFTVGTRWARNDDAAVLDSDPDCLTIYVMIEERSEPVTFANMLDAGEPTLPEWFDREAIAKEKRDYIKDKKLGPVALLANLFLTVSADAAKVFNDEIVDARVFQWLPNEKTAQYVARLEDSKKPDGKILKFPVRNLEKKAGADPSTSMTGDEWAVACLGRDHFGTRYQLFTISGRGPEEFLDALLKVNALWNPDEIGIEKAAQQHWVLVAISKDPRFQAIADKFVAVPHGGRRKQDRATDLVAAPMEMGEFYLNPNDKDTAEQMKQWDPDAKKAADGRIDALGIAAALYTTPAIGYSSGEIAEMARIDNERYEKSIDADFGIPLESVMADDDWADDTFEVDYDDEAVGY